MSEERFQCLCPDWPAPPTVYALTTTRAGGASSGAYRSFNLADHVGDDRAAVAKNRARTRAALSLPGEPVWLKQVHGINVIDAATASSDPIADGAYVAQKGVVCAILTADCLPIFICNREGTEAGLLHGGWRGLAGGVVEAGLRLFRAPRSDLLVWLGPAISQRAYEVGEEVRAAFLSHDRQAAQAFVPSEAGKWYMDLYSLARQRFVQQDILSVFGGTYCTATQPDLFFSHRRDGTTGRMASFIWLA